MESNIVHLEPTDFERLFIYGSVNKNNLIITVSEPEECVSSILNLVMKVIKDCRVDVSHE